MIFAILLIGAVVVVVAVCIAFEGRQEQNDEARLRGYLNEKGSTLLGMVPQRNRAVSAGQKVTGRRVGAVYDITYEDADGRIHYAECETSADLGVVLRRDGIRESDLREEAPHPE